MWMCQKCHVPVTEPSKICRSCGGILDEVPNEDSEPARPDWVCPDCGETVPGSFDVCWNCAAKSATEHDADAEQVSGPVQESEQDTEAGTRTESEIDEEPPRVTTECPRCGSTKIIPDLTVVDQGDSSDGRLQTVVFGSPDALFFKDRLYGEIKADVCGDCGHIELHVANPHQLYRRYQKSRGLDQPSNLRQRWAVPCPSCRMLITTGSGSCPHCGAVQRD
jgi:predicted RNA-binding Zn-ribbon protein involved in translation (DUF1610 family)